MVKVNLLAMESSSLELILEEIFQIVVVGSFVHSFVMEGYP